MSVDTEEDALLLLSLRGLNINDKPEATHQPETPRERRSKTLVLINPNSTLHKYIRDKATLAYIVERPERIRAVKIGISAAYVLLQKKLEEPKTDISGLLHSLSLSDGVHITSPGSPFHIQETTRTLDVMHKALEIAHGKEWPKALQQLCQNASSNIAKKQSEIPSNLHQGDLYLCEGSEKAIFGSLGTVCEGVDLLAKNDYDRIFSVIRPPGHHCESEKAMGFCFINNVAVAAAYAHLTHGINKVVIFDIDLHHGNGTQDIVWQINESARYEIEKTRALKEEEARKRKSATSRKSLTALEDVAPPLQIMYGSTHDVQSYPCEDGNVSNIHAASLTLEGGHNQYISNVHLESWSDESDFYSRLYPKYKERMFSVAETFLRQVAGTKSLVIVSCGLDASEHESSGMSRHTRNVPTSFYARFAQDTVKFAQKHTNGKVLVVLEGGYSDRALTSGTLSFLSGFALEEIQQLPAGPSTTKEMDNWGLRSLVALEKACKLKRNKKLNDILATPAKPSSPLKNDILAQIVQLFSRLERIPIDSHLSIPSTPEAATKSTYPASILATTRRSARKAPALHKEGLKKSPVLPNLPELSTDNTGLKTEPIETKPIVERERNVSAATVPRSYMRQEIRSYTAVLPDRTTVVTELEARKIRVTPPAVERKDSLHRSREHTPASEISSHTTYPGSASSERSDTSLKVKLKPLPSSSSASTLSLSPEEKEQEHQHPHIKFTWKENGSM